MEGVQNDKNHKGSHYMGYRLSWLREQVADLLVRFEHVESKKNDSDIFTKVPQEEDYSRLREPALEATSPPALFDSNEQPASDTGQDTPPKMFDFSSPTASESEGQSESGKLSSTPGATWHINYIPFYASVSMLACQQYFNSGQQLSL